MVSYQGILRRAAPILVILFIALGVGSAVIIRRLSIEAGTDVLLDQKDPDLAYYHQTRADWSTTDEYVILGCTGPDWFTREGVESLKSFADQVRGLPHVRDVTSILTVPLLRNQPPRSTPIGLMPSPILLDAPNCDLTKACEELLKHTQALGNLISEDGRTTSVIAYLDTPAVLAEVEPRRNWLLGSPQSPEVRAELAAIEPRYRAGIQENNRRRLALVEGCRRLAREWSLRFGKPVRLAGIPIINVNLVEHIRHDLKVFSLLALGLFLVTLALIYRRWLWFILPIAGAVLAASFGVALLVALGYRMTVITSNLPVLLFVMTLPYGIYLIERTRERRSSFPQETAAETAAGAAGEIWTPCLYSATTTMAGFASLITSGIVPVYTFGLLGSIGMTFALAATFLFLAPSLRMARPVEVRDAGVQSRLPAPLRPLASAVRGRPGVVVGASLVLLGAAAWGTTRLTAEAKFINYFWPSSEIYVGLEFIDTRMGGTTPVEVILKGPPGTFRRSDGLKALEEVGSFFATVPETGNVRSFRSLVDEARKAWPKTFKEEAIVGFLHMLVGPKLVWRCAECGSQRLDAAGSEPPAIGSTNAHECPTCRRETSWRLERIDGGIIGEFCSVDYSQARVLVRMRETAPTLNRKAILDRLRAHLARSELASFEPRPTGIFVLYSNMLQTLLKGQRDTFLMVVAAIWAMLLILFRSPILATIVLFPQVLPVLVVLGAMGFARIPLDMVTTMIASVAMGIGIDSAIQYTVRFRRELRAAGNPAAAVSRCHATIGRAILIAVGTMFAGFLVLTMSDFVPTAYFGVFTGLAMLMGLLASLTTLPALFVLLKYPRVDGQRRE